MAKVLSSISGNLISAASAGYAPTNSGDVSAIASAYQVVSSTGTQLYAGTAYVTSVNGDALSAARAGNAANAVQATSAWYDGTGRLISSLPDAAEVSSIASSYAESAASSKADSSSLSSYALSSDVSGVIDTVSANSASWSGGTLPITGSAGNDSATYGAGYVEYTRYDTAGEPDIRTASLSPDQFYIDYTLDENDHTIMTLTESMLDFTDSEGDHVVDAYSIDTWNSAVDTVANNSASWGGGATGDYVEKSATEVAIGSANSASSYSLAQGSRNMASSYSLAQGTGNMASSYSLAQGTGNMASARSLAQGLTNSAHADSFAQGWKNTALTASFAQGWNNIASSASFAQGDHNSATNTAAVFGKYNLRGDGDTATGNSAAFAIGDGTATGARHDLMVVTKDGEITMYSSTADTTGTGIMSAIRAISAAATGGGIDSATCSAIASSYAESAVSSKQDSSAMSAYALSSDVSGVIDTVSINSASWGAGATLPIIGSAGTDSATYGETSVEFYRYDTAGEPDIRTATLSPDALDITYTVDENDYYSVHINENGVEFSDPDGYYTVTPYDITNWNSAVETVANNSAAWGQGGVDSATVSSIASSYAESAASSKQDSSAMTSYALSSDVSGTVDLVSTQSANWGGSALALSAGPGVKLEMSGNTLVAGLDETVLWTGSLYPTNSAALTYPLTAFERVRFTWRDWNTNGSYHVEEFEPLSRLYSLCASWFGGTTSVFLFHINVSATNDYGTVTFTDGVFAGTTGTSYNSATATIVTKIVGINRTAGV